MTTIFKVIKNEDDYNAALIAVEELISKDPELGSDDADKLDLLASLIEEYESKKFPETLPEPVEAIKFRMEQMNLKQIDIAPLFGGTTRVSEVLHGRRQLTLKMIILLQRYLGIPLESLIAGNRKIKLEPEKKNKLLRIPSIKNYLRKNDEIALA